MMLTRKYVISMVLINVLLLGCVSCRPNADGDSANTNDNVSKLIM